MFVSSKKKIDILLLFIFILSKKIKIICHTITTKHFMCNLKYSRIYFIKYSKIKRENWYFYLYLS